MHFSLFPVLPAFADFTVYFPPFQVQSLFWADGAAPDHLVRASTLPHRLLVSRKLRLVWKLNCAKVFLGNWMVHRYFLEIEWRTSIFRKLNFAVFFGNVENYLLWLQLKALFLNMVYLHERALSSPPTPHQVLKKTLPKTTYIEKKYAQGEYLGNHKWWLGGKSRQLQYLFLTWK